VNEAEKVTLKINNLLEIANSKGSHKSYSLIDFNKLLVGAFLMFGLSSITIIVALTLQSQHYFDKTYTLFLNLEKGLGLSKGTSVQVNGVKVGSVEEILLMHGGGVTLKLNIREKNAHHITTKSVGYPIRAQNIIANRIIYITHGEGGRVLQHMDIIKSDEAQDIETLLSNVSNLLEEVHFLVKAGDSLIKMASNPKSTVGALLNNDNLFHKIDGSIDKLDRLSNNSNNLITKLDKKIVPIFDNLNNIQKDIRLAMDAGQFTLAQADSLFKDLRQASEHAPELMEQIETLLIEGRGSMKKVDEIFENIENSSIVGPLIIPQRDSLSPSLGKEEW
jgi:ABC-type transporter Mla subunit MlaD